MELKSILDLANVCRVKIAESKVSVTFVGGEALNIAGAEAETARKRLQPYFVDIPA